MIKVSKKKLREDLERLRPKDFTRRYDVSITTRRNLLKKLGISPFSRLTKLEKFLKENDDLSKLKKDLREMRNSELVDKYGVKQSTISQARKKLGIKSLKSRKIQII